MGSLWSLAQPAWDITPSDYQYTMTVTGEGLIDCQASIDSADWVAAFVDDTCRGVINFGTEVNGSNLAYLIVYSNQSLGEEVSFKIWDASEDVIIDLLNQETFEENSTKGSSGSPYLFSNNQPPTALNISDIVITDASNIGDTIANFDVDDTDNSIYSYTFLNTDSNDNAFFTLVDNFLLLENDIDFSVQSSFEIEIEAIDANGCSISDTFTIAAQNTNEAPTGISFENENASVDENENVGTFVSIFLAEDNSAGDSFTYTLEDGGVDNSSFSIAEDELLTDNIFDYEIKNEYIILVRVTDASGNFAIEEMTVFINDVIELDDLKANNVITPNGDGYNDFFSVPNITLFANYEFTVYNENGNQIYRRSPSAGYNNLWDGKTSDGKDLPSGVYYYILSDYNSDNQFTGTVNLIRN